MSTLRRLVNRWLTFYSASFAEPPRIGATHGSNDAMNTPPSLGQLAATGLRPPAAADAAASVEPAHSLLLAQDGRHLAATWFEPPAGHSTRAVALISSATGVPRGYYRAFAQWLAQRGYAVMTYDYRGIGGSRRGSLRDEPASMRDWAVLDMSAAVSAARARAQAGVRGSADTLATAPRPGGGALPLLLVGHSFGGNCIAFARGVEQASALLCVGSQLGEPRLYPGHHRWLAEFYFRALLPAVVKLHGYAPSWAAGGEPLPAQVALQWGHWGLTRGWAYADPQMQAHRQASALAVPVHLWGLSDDLQYAPPAAIDALAEQFRNAAVQRHTVRPQELGLKALGHFGAFRRSASSLWPRWMDAIEAAAPQLAARAPAA
jgi:predicted alpha/beta hydrolase